jgi:Tol biopolymer transport system component
LPALLAGDRIAWAHARGDKMDIWLMMGDGSSPVQITSVDSVNREPAWSLDGRLIAFASNRDGNNEIYIMRADGSNATRLTNNPANDYAPAWSPDGNSIAFVSNRDGNDEIYLMRADGSGQARLSDHGAFDGQPAWSPDGRLIAFTSSRDGGLNIYVMPAAGGAVTRLTSASGDNRDPAWAPDGSRLAVVTLDGLWTYSPALDDARQVVATPAPARPANEFDYVALQRPRWSPDGLRIAYLATNGGTTRVEVVEVATGRKVYRSAADTYSFEWTSDPRALRVGEQTIRLQ